VRKKMMKENLKLVDFARKANVKLSENHEN
jgi:hypothetical protein